MRSAEHWVGVVDDDASMRIALARLLRGNGIRAEAFGSAEEYLERSVDGQPCCIILDVHLGGLSGFDLQERLESQGNAPPIIFITADEEVCARRLGERASTCGYLRKPFDSEGLMTLVLTYLEGDEPVTAAM